VIEVDGRPYVVDCGLGVVQQLLRAGIELRNLRHIFLTHHHADHNAEYGNLLLMAWVSGLNHPINAWGPPPLGRMTELFWEMNQYDIGIRIADEGRPDPRTLVKVHEYSQSQVVMEDEWVKVTALAVPHPPVKPNFAYRFDSQDGTIVISGDCAPNPQLIEFASGADVLVHEALYLPGLDAIVKRNPNAKRLLQHLVDSHTSTEEVGRVAAAAGVKSLILSHLVPGDDSSISDEMWLEGVRQHYSGEVKVGRDLLEVSLGR
jgi:ribonuclease BN (tRNA processing enzyme)